MEEQKCGLAASRNRPIAKTSVQAASSLCWIDRPIGFKASTRFWIDKKTSVEVARRRWIGKNSGLVASGKRWTEKTSGLEASRTLRDDLEGLKHYACSGFEASTRPDDCEQTAQGGPELDL